MKEIIILLNIILVILIGCKKPTEPPDPPPPPPPIVEEPILKLELDDAHCTEAWILFTSTKLKTPNTLTLKQFNPNGDSLIRTINIITPDTMLYIDSLLPKKTYRYKVEATANNKVYTTNELIVQTMDTTIHNFTFEMYTFGGEIGGSVLYDVAIINENNIWAVGDILIKSDTSETGYIQYNAVHWNGSHWQLKRIRYYGGCSSVEYPPLNAIWAFSENNIVITNGGSIGWFNGETVNLDCRVYPLLTGAINKIWGTSINNLYAVGNLGTIVHYNGMSWRKIESHTTLNINDIWGDYNPKTKEWEILAVASDYPSSLNKEILKIVNETVFKLPTSDQMEPLYTVWFMPNKQYYVAGSGIYQKRLLTDLYWKNDPTDITGFATTCIRGNNINDVFGVGAFGDFVHFNGVRWKQYQEPYLYNGAYTKVAVKGDLVVAVGGNQVSLASEAVILIGRR